MACLRRFPGRPPGRVFCHPSGTAESIAEKMRKRKVQEFAPHLQHFDANAAASIEKPLELDRNFVLPHAEGGDNSILVSPVALPDSGKTVVFATAAIFGKTAAISAYLPDSGKPVQVFLARLEKLKKMLRFCVITQSRWWQLQLEAAIAGGVFVKVDQVVKVYVVVKVNVV